MTTLGSIVKYRKGKPPKVGPNGRLPVLSPHYLRTGQVEEMAEPTSKDVVLNGGEIILLWDGSNAGEFFRARAGVLSSTMVAFEFDQEEINPDYLYYDLKRFEPELKGRTAGSGIPHVDKELLLAREIIEGSLDEQKAAAKVLLKVDRAIEQTEALLAKQQRIKTGLMHDLLTRGLDAQGRLRDPSTHRFKETVLGTVPEGWDDTNLGTLAALVTSGPRGWARYYAKAGAKFIRIGNLTREHVNFRLEDMQFVDPPAGAEGNRTQLKPGDVLLSITADLGIVGLIPTGFGPAYINQHIALIRPKADDVVSGWLANFLAGHRIQKWIANINESGAKAGLNLPTIKSIPVTAPKPPEQKMIADILVLCDRQVAQIRARILKLHRQRAGLMHDLLTGRVPVTPLLTNLKTQITT